MRSGTDRFDFAVAALSKEVIQLCFAAVAHPDEDEPYTRLKEDLLQQHSLTKYQRCRGAGRLPADGVRRRAWAGHPGIRTIRRMVSRRFFIAWLRCGRVAVV